MRRSCPLNPYSEIGIFDCRLKKVGHTAENIYYLFVQLFASSDKNEGIDAFFDGHDLE